MSIPFPPPRPRKQQRSPEEELKVAVRSRLVNEMHLGQRRAGDRLPSIREVARSTGADHRLVARVYRSLEEEGLVEVRGRSGVSVAGPDLLPAVAPNSAEQRLAHLVVEGWKQGLSAAEVRVLLSSASDFSHLRIACLESNLDQMHAFCEEIQQTAGVEVLPLFIPPDAMEEVRDLELRERLHTALQEADLVVTTHYHAAVAHGLLKETGIPLLHLCINPGLTAAVRTHLAERTLTVVAADPEFSRRLRLMCGDVAELHGRLRVLLVEDQGNIEELDAEEPILLTRAAAAALPHLSGRCRPYADLPVLAPETLSELGSLLVHLSLQRLQSVAGASPYTSQGSPGLPKWP